MPSHPRPVVLGPVVLSPVVLQLRRSSALRRLRTACPTSDVPFSLLAAASCVKGLPLCQNRVHDEGCPVIPRHAPMLFRDVADGVHQLTVSHTNLYIVEHESGILLVDAGLPVFWPHLLIALKELGADPTSVTGVLLTHAHFDHVGCVRRARREWNVPVWHHAADTALLAHPYRYNHERARLPYVVRYPRNLPALWDFAMAGALVVRGETGGTPLGAELQLPTAVLAGSGTVGGPVVLATPGHTAGHIALHLPDRDALLVGDSLVTLDPYTGATGPQIVAGAATADSAVALRSLETLAATGATTVLPGHGAAWTGGIGEAVAAAWATGAH